MHDLPPSLETRSAPHTLRRRWKPLGVLSLAAVLLHAAVFSGADWVWPQADVAQLPSLPMQVRVVDVPMTVAAGSLPVVLQSEASVMSAAPRRVPTAVRVKRETASVAVPLASFPIAEIAARELVPPVPSAGSVTAAHAASAPEADEETVPSYRTQLPPALTLHYEMQRGMLHGTGDLSWRPQAGLYEMKLEAKVSGLPVLMQTSSGAIDVAGIAPVRYVDQRIRKSATSANFQREAGKITFSGSSAEFALRAGAQDRLSWMVQLAAVVSAEPQLAKAGAKVVLYVVGSHGDASVWVFRCIGPETVDTRAGPIDAIKFTREPREPYDTTIQVWLDPRQHALPVRATQRSGPGDEGYELRLIEAVAAN
jgi:hypothetical protein